jgi:hypothetical protein
MFRPMIAALLLAAPGAAAIAQDENQGSWGVAAMPNGCMVEAVSPQGTMLSIWGFAGAPRLAFLLQNKEWGALRDGQSYKLNLEFAGMRSWPVDATARENIDSDGPGYLFTVQPGGEGAAGFLNAFTSAKGMRISRDGRSVDTLPLEGSRGAMAALAKCLAARWSAAAPQGGQQEDSDSPAPASSASSI